MKTILVSILASLSLVSAQPEPHKNRTVYAELDTGIPATQFLDLHPSFKEAVTANYLALEERSQTDYSITIKRADKVKLLDRYVEKITVRILRPPDVLKCDSIVEAAFLGRPPSRRNRTPESLYSYSYLVCAGTGDVTPQRLLDKYQEKYGNYDVKDYDRSQIVYNGVKESYEVRVKPVTASSGQAGLVITVTDYTILKIAYDGWRRRVRDAENSAMGRL